MSTASALERMMECPTSAVISPIVHDSEDAADRGDAIHVFCRSCIAGTPRSLALQVVHDGVSKNRPDDERRKQWRETCEQIDITTLTAGLSNVRAEVAYRITTHEDAEDTVRELGINLNRRYPERAANDTDGTNDFEGQEPITGLWVVTDIKTGFWPVTECRINPQMKFHARALMLKHGVDRVKARIAYIAVDGQISWDVHVFTRFDLDTFSDDIVSTRTKIARANERLKATGQLEVFAGDWCRYCSAKNGCPKFTTLALSMLGDMREIHERWGQMTPEQKAEAFLKAYETRDLSTRIVESMKMLARDTPIPLPNGKELRETSSGVRAVNAPKAERRRRVA